MNVTTDREGEKLTISAEGKLGTGSAPDLDKALKDNIDGVSELVFDFDNLEFMASAGLRVLLSAAKIMKKQGSMKIINVSPAVMDVFTFTGMADKMTIEPRK